MWLIDFVCLFNSVWNFKIQTVSDLPAACCFQIAYQFWLTFLVQSNPFITVIYFKLLSKDIPYVAHDSSGVI